MGQVKSDMRDGSSQSLHDVRALRGAESLIQDCAATTEAQKKSLQGVSPKQQYGDSYKTQSY